MKVKVSIFNTEGGQICWSSDRWNLLSLVHLVKYIFIMETLNEMDLSSFVMQKISILISNLLVAMLL